MESLDETRHNGSVTYREMGRNGRLANQMFQIAGTISYALTHNKSFVFPYWPYSKYMQKELPIGELLDTINVPVQFHYAPIEDIPGKNVNLVSGHMQSSKYFAHHWETIKPYLTIKNEYKEAILSKYSSKEILSSKKICSIHCRLCDYTLPVNIEYHGMCSMDYYRNAVIAIFGEDRPRDVLFVIFSDEIDKAKKMFNLPNMYFVEPDDSIVPKMKDFSGLPMGNGDLMDLFLMSFCSNNIICNSSFSWFAAWLNENPDKKVVAPIKWFSNAPIITKDIIEKNWIAI